MVSNIMSLLLLLVTIWLSYSVYSVFSTIVIKMYGNRDYQKLCTIRQECARNTITLSRSDGWLERRRVLLYSLRGQVVQLQCRRGDDGPR